MITARHRTSTLAAASALALVAVACGGGDEPPPPTATDTGSGADEDGGADDGSAGADADAFPVTIEHALGTTTIEAPPERVATVSAANQDVAIALGVVPVAVPFVDYGGGEEGVLPWVREAVEASGAAMPEVVGTSVDEVAFEGIAATSPDLILATYSGLTEEEYATLSEIAPVVAYPDAPYATSWQDQTLVAGEALGRSDLAEELVADTEALLDGAVEAVPELDGATFVYTGGVDQGAFGIFRPADVRVALVEDLGLEVAPSVEDDAPDDGGVYYTLSLERTAELDADVVIGFFGDQALVDDFLADPSVQRIPAVAAGAFAPIVGEAEVVASSAPSVLSIPWVLDGYLPILAEAARAAS